MARPRQTLMGWTVATSLRFRYLVAALGVLLMAVGLVVVALVTWRKGSRQGVATVFKLLR